MDAKLQSQVLIESLPYLRKFHGETVVIKYGGHAMKDEALKAAFARNIALLKLVGIPSPETRLDEYPHQFSGGQRQRLALARALLHDTPVYLFDEATSNIDVESENDIMAEIHALARRKTVILISHRLANVTVSDNIYVLDGGALAGQGTHDALLRAGGVYARLWDAQQALENYAKEGAAL